jgi:hypothetical protein
MKAVVLIIPGFPDQKLNPMRQSHRHQKQASLCREEVFAFSLTQAGSSAGRVVIHD